MKAVCAARKGFSVLQSLDHSVNEWRLSPSGTTKHCRVGTAWFEDDPNALSDFLVRSLSHSYSGFLQVEEAYLGIEWGRTLRRPLCDCSKIEPLWRSGHGWRIGTKSGNSIQHRRGFIFELNLGCLECPLMELLQRKQENDLDGVDAVKLQKKPEMAGTVRMKWNYSGLSRGCLILTFW